jgi:hypothetical protein
LKEKGVIETKYLMNAEKLLAKKRIGETGAMWDTGLCWTQQLKYVKIV